MKTYDKIDQIIIWYAAQLSGATRLFKGEENEMTTVNIHNKLNHYHQLAGLLQREKLRPAHLAQIDRAHYFNCQKWPLPRIQERAAKIEKSKTQAA